MLLASERRSCASAEREAVADRGAELGHVADREVADDLLEQLRVLRERALQHRLLPEHDEADAIVVGLVQEPPHHALRGIEPIALHVGLFHRLRHVDDEHDVDRIDLVLDDAIGLRPRQRDRERADGDDAQRRRQIRQPRRRTRAA